MAVAPVFEKQFDRGVGDSPHSMRDHLEAQGAPCKRGRRARELTGERQVREKFYVSSSVTPQHSEESGLCRTIVAWGLSSYRAYLTYG